MDFFIAGLIGFGVGAFLGLIIFRPILMRLREESNSYYLQINQMARGNAVLRRELAELRAAHEAPRDHGYGQTHG